MGFTFKPVTNDAAKSHYVLSCREDSGFIGYMLGDFGKTGVEFHMDWVCYNPNLDDDTFRKDFELMFSRLRNTGIMQNFMVMSDICKKTPNARLPNNVGYVFRVESLMFEYYIRAIPNIHDFHFYIYCYARY